MSSILRPEGHIKIVVHHATKLTNTQCCSKMDPFVRARLGPNVEDTVICKSGHDKPKWPTLPTLFLEVGFNEKEKYDNLVIEVLNKNLIADDLIGTVTIPVSRLKDQAAHPEAADPEPLWLGNPKNNAVHAGDLYAVVRYIPPLIVTVHEAKELPDVQLIGKQDPYVLLDMRGCIAKGDTGLRKGRTHDDGALHPIWNQNFAFNVLDERELRRHLESEPKKPLTAHEEKSNDPGLWIQVMDENVIVDAAICYCYISLFELLKTKNEGVPRWFQLYRGKKEVAGKEERGKISISVKQA